MRPEGRESSMCNNFNPGYKRNMGEEDEGESEDDARQESGQGLRLGKKKILKS